MSAGAGGIVAGPATGPELDIVTARSYRHPVLDGRTVVRLIGATVGPAEDLSMEFLGFATAAEPVAVGHGRRSALGFPAWALVHDPANGRHALALVKDLERLARTARHKPGNARDGYTALARRLGAAAPQLLPTFWEQAGRAFLAAGNQRMAGSCFSEARRAEQVHGLTVDEDRVRDVHLEFALAGGLPAAMLTAYARQVAARQPAAEAYELVKNLALRRVAGGLPPHATMASDLAGLAKAAGLDAGREAEEVVAQLLTYPAIARSHPSVWKSYRTSLVRLGRHDGTARARLLEIMPDPPGAEIDIRDQWLELLDATGAAADLVAGTGGKAGRWLTRFLEAHEWSLHRRGSDGRNARLLALVERLAPRLAAEGGVKLSDHPWTCDLDLLDLCRAEGVPVDVGDSGYSHGFEVTEWAADLGAGRRDLTAIAADPRLRPLLRKGVREALDKLRSGRRRTRSRLSADTLPGGFAMAGVRAVLIELGEDLAGPAEQAPGQPRVEDTALRLAVHGISRSGSTYDGGSPSFELVEQVAATGRLLGGSDGPISAVAPDWLDLLAGLGAVALRAASAATSDKDRAALAGFLTAVAGSPLDGSGPPLRVVEVTQEEAMTGDVDVHRDGPRVTVLFVPPAFHPHAVGVRWQRPTVQLDPDGVFPLPAQPVRYEHDSFRPSGRLAGERLRTFLTLLAERGPAPWRPSAAAALAQATGVSGAAAALLLAGLPGIDRTQAGFLNTEQRRLLGLDAAHAKAARTGLRELSHPERIALLDAAMPADPLDLWEHGPDVAAIAEKWIALRGRQVAVPDDLVAGLSRIVDKSLAPALLRAIAAPAPGDWLTTGSAFDDDHLRAAVIALSWLAYNLTWDDPLRAVLPEALRLVRERLRDPDLRVGHVWFRTEHRPHTGPALVDESINDSWVQVAVAPAHLTGWQDPVIGLADDNTATALRLALSSLLGRAVTTPAGATGDPRDPRVSVPALVDQVRERHGLDPGAAAYYLQLLALPDPTDKAVQRWNGWKLAELRAAQQALTEAGLVAVAKRDRAGRPVFLPGGWQTARAPRLPVETWKLRILAEIDGVLLTLWAVPDQFGMAWERIVEGDVPRYHDLAASR
jgi:hypothetical protein